MYKQRDTQEETTADEEHPEGEQPTEEPPKKRRKLQKLPPFTTQMKEDLQKGKWLTDEHIQLA